MPSSPLDRLKPRPTEANARVRTNGVGLVAMLVLTNLLPLPSPWEASRQLWSSYVYRSRAFDSLNVWYVLCLSELLVIATLAFNILQALYAIQFPPAALPPPTPSPAKPKPTPMQIAANSPKSTPGLAQSPKRLVGMTPASTSISSHQPQKSFSSSFYASSPLSSPSRTINYAADTSINSNFSLPATPSPGGSVSANVLAMSMGLSGSAGRGRQRAGAGRAFDGELLNRFTQSTVAEIEG